MTPEEKKRTQLIQKSLDGVVSVTATQKGLNNFSAKPSFQISFLEKLTRKVINQGGGSGFVVNSKGIVVTNTHIIPKTNCVYTIITNNNKTYSAELIGMDDVHDVAFLKIKSSEVFHSLPLGDSSKIVLGQTVYAIGNVLGYFRNTISYGIVSGLTRSIEAMNEERKEELHGLIQTDAAINPGNSGGPLIDSDGKVIGINSAAVPHAENIAFAIPINVIKNNLADILKYGKIRRAYLGVRHIIINERIQKAFGLPISYGIWAVSPSKNDAAIIHGSPAYKSGLREKDIISEINGKKLGENFTLEEFLEDAKGGQKITLSIIRGKRNISLKAELIEKK